MTTIIQSATVSYALCALALMGCANGPGTQRVYHGRTVVGPYIAPETYAAYAEGAYLEAHGEWTRAEAAYRRALREHGDSASLWTRVGVIRCRSNLSEALEAFDSATEHGGYAPAWSAMASCLRTHGRNEDALRAAQRAVELDPLAADANLLIAALHREQGRPSAAAAWLFAWLLLDPDARAHAVPISKEAAVLRDQALAGLLASQLRSGARTGSELDAATHDALMQEQQAATLTAVRAALRAGDIDEARTTAMAARISRLDLAQVAIALGLTRLAAKESELVLAADPENGDAWAAAICAAALEGDMTRFDQLLRGPRRVEATHQALHACVTDLIRWWISESAADDFAQAERRTQTAGSPRTDRSF